MGRQDEQENRKAGITFRLLSVVKLNKISACRCNGKCIVFCFEGSFGVASKDGMFTIEKNKFCMLDTDMGAAVKCMEKDGDVYVISVNSLMVFGAFVGLIEKQGLFVCDMGGDEAVMKDIVVHLQSEFYQQRQYYLEICDSLLYTLDFLLYRAALLDNETLQEDLPVSVKMYIDQNYTEDISLGSIAAEFFISTDHLSHIFKSRFGVSPINYLINRRIIKAQTLLANTSESVNTISGIVGYDNVSYFSTLFRKVVGMTPANFRLESRRNI